MYLLWPFAQPSICLFLNLNSVHGSLESPGKWADSLGLVRRGRHRRWATKSQAIWALLMNAVRGYSFGILRPVKANKIDFDLRKPSHVGLSLYNLLSNIAGIRWEQCSQIIDIKIRGCIWCQAWEVASILNSSVPSLVEFPYPYNNFFDAYDSFTRKLENLS